MLQSKVVKSTNLTGNLPLELYSSRKSQGEITFSSIFLKCYVCRRAELGLINVHHRRGTAITASQTSQHSIGLSVAGPAILSSIPSKRVMHLSDFPNTYVRCES